MPNYGTTITMCPWIICGARGCGRPPSCGCMCLRHNAYWQSAQEWPAHLATVTTALAPWPWIAIALAAVAKFKYPAECVAHRCQGSRTKGPCTTRLVRREEYRQSSALPCERTSVNTMGT